MQRILFKLVKLQGFEHTHARGEGR